MPNPSREPTKVGAIRLKYRGRFDAVMMLVYLSVVYGWTLWVYPLGRDYAVLADPTGTIPGVSGHVLSSLASVFGPHIPLYHLTSLALLYVCMLCIYRIVNLTIGGLWWLGTLAASLFMANPVHTESLLNLVGAVDLLPTFSALLFLAAYTSNAAKPAAKSLGLSIALFVVAVGLFPENSFLVWVVLLYECLVVPSERRNLARFMVFFCLGAVGDFIHADAIWASAERIRARLASLYLLIYPIGYLPKTVSFFETHPWLGWVVAGIVAFLLTLLCRSAKRPAIVFGLLAMAVLRLAPDARPVDPVHLIGGGQLLTANAFYALALVAVFERVMHHPRWRASVVTFTTVLAAFFFGLQISANLDWKTSSEVTRSFQEKATMTSRGEPSAVIGVLPDWQYVGWAPMQLSDSIMYVTPFSKALPHVSLLKLSEPERGAYKLSSGGSSPSKVEAVFSTRHKEGFSYAGTRTTAEGLSVSKVEVEDTPENGAGALTMRVEIQLNGRSLPDILGLSE